MGERPAPEGWDKLRCPRCGTEILVDLKGGPRPEIHTRRGGREGRRDFCKLVVVPDPARGEHALVTVEAGQRAEDVAASLRPEWDRRFLAGAPIMRMVA